MEDKVKDGGPAFPGAELPAHPNHPTGMSLRDWFAGQALHGLCSDKEFYSMRIELLALEAYKYADAMLAAREPTQ